MVVSGLLLMSNLCVLSQKHYWKEHVLEKTLKYKKKKHTAHVSQNKISLLPVFGLSEFTELLKPPPLFHGHVLAAVVNVSAGGGAL